MRIVGEGGADVGSGVELIGVDDPGPAAGSQGVGIDLAASDSGGDAIDGESLEAGGFVEAVGLAPAGPDGGGVGAEGRQDVSAEAVLSGGDLSAGSDQGVQEPV